jgi:hypothetical protein
VDSRAAWSLVLILAASAAARADDRNCTEREREYFDFDLLRGHKGVDALGAPFQRIATNPLASEKCKVDRLDDLVSLLKLRLEKGPCIGGPCDELRSDLDRVEQLLSTGDPICQEEGCDESGNHCSCAMTPDYSETLQAADDSLGRIVYQSAAAIESKIEAGTLPTCLYPEGCPGKSCMRSLAKLWWNDSYENGSKDSELWLKAGGFAHLLLGTSLTCPSKGQSSGTCTIEASLALMSHYCASPSLNPAASGGCSSKGPGFRCASFDEFLGELHSNQGWQAIRCGESGASSACAPSPSNPNFSRALDLAAKYKKECPEPNRKTEKCIVLQKAVKNGADDVESGAEVKEGSGKAWYRGREGINRTGYLESAFLKFGFEPVFFGADSDGWAAAVATIRSGHPVELGIDVDGWTDYDPSMPGLHEVVMEGDWKDPSGHEWILVKDSNNPKVLKLIQEQKMGAAFTGATGKGGLALCVPASRAHCDHGEPTEARPDGGIP